MRSALTAAKSLAQEINERRIKLDRSTGSQGVQSERYRDADDFDADGEEEFDIAGLAMPQRW